MKKEGVTLPFTGRERCFRPQGTDEEGRSYVLMTGVGKDDDRKATQGR